MVEARCGCRISDTCSLVRSSYGWDERGEMMAKGTKGEVLGVMYVYDAAEVAWKHLPVKSDAPMHNVE